MDAISRQGRDANTAVPLSILIAVLGICFLGGTSEAYPLPRGIAQACGAAIFGIAIANGTARLPRDVALRLLVIATVALVVAQAVPLPPSLWRELPGREIAAAVDDALGWQVWRPVTLDWEAALEVLLFLLPCLAVLLVAGREGWRVSIAGAFALGGAIAAVFAILQALDSEWLRPFDTPHKAYVVGPFLNRNHLALFVTCAGLLAMGWAREQAETSGGPLRRLLAGAAMALAGIVVLLSGSRSGLAVYAAALAGLAWVWLAAFWHSRIRATLAVIVALAAVAGVVFFLARDAGGPLAAIAGRQSLLLDRRFEIWPASWALVATYWPVGSGFGTFREVFAIAEPLAELRPLYVNHAHNDYIELVVEGGVAAAAILSGFAVWLLVRTFAVLRTDAAARPLQWAALACLWLIAAQSLVEYSARTVAVAALASFCLAIVARKPAKIRQS